MESNPGCLRFKRRSMMRLKLRIGFKVPKTRSKFKVLQFKSGLVPTFKVLEFKALDHDRVQSTQVKTGIGARIWIGTRSKTFKSRVKIGSKAFEVHVNITDGVSNPIILSPGNNNPVYTAKLAEVHEYGCTFTPQLSESKPKASSALLQHSSSISSMY
ncbi:hypothetical protein NC652_002260 [Populus alba x Populus x berolinensis]|nr:hypothetical protein NC652_002260 [Populus alba x Populus x berolinensis]